MSFEMFGCNLSKICREHNRIITANEAKMAQIGVFPEKMMDKWFRFVASFAKLPNHENRYFQFWDVAVVGLAPLELGSGIQI
jgi:hypothetical protein